MSDRVPDVEDDTELEGLDDEVRDEPRPVRLIRDALTDRLGRPACARGRKGGKSNAWVVSDPCFAWIQQGKAGMKNYRSGILVTDKIVKFYNEHSRVLADIFRENLIKDPVRILLASETTHDLRSFHALSWSSKAAYAHGYQKGRSDHVHDEWEIFLQGLECIFDGIPSDLFPVMPSTGAKGGTGKFRGTLFLLELAETRHLNTADEVAAREVADRVVEAAWHLFACYYPWERMRWRSTDLARFMRSARIPRQCEHKCIQGYDGGECGGSVEAAHIKPDGHGGSDRAWNGLWLCQRHHRDTEGKLKGQRDKTDLMKVDARFTSDGSYRPRP